MWPDTDPAVQRVRPNNPDARDRLRGGRRNQTSDLVAIADDLVAFCAFRLRRLGFRGILELNGDALSACGARLNLFFGQKFRRDGTGLAGDAGRAAHLPRAERAR